MRRILAFVLLVSVLAVALTAPTPAEEPKEEDVEGRTGRGRLHHHRRGKKGGFGGPGIGGPGGYGPGFGGGFGPGLGGGQYGSAFNQGGSFQTGAEGNRYGQGGFNYNVGGSKRRDYGNVQTYGDRESFGLSENAGANRATGQSSFGNEYKNQEQGSGGQQFSSGFSG